MPSLRGALIGFGRIAEAAHAPAFKSHKRLAIAAVCDADPGRLRAAQAAFPQAEVFSDLAGLWRSGRFDFAVIATPPSSHAALASAALERGCHVLCEKPLALKPGEIAELRRAALAANRALFSVHNWRQAPLYRRLFELVGSGAIGEIRHVELHVLRQKPAASAADGWRTDPRMAGGGILVDHGWHNLYLLHGLLRQPAVRVAASRTPPSGRADMETCLFMEFPRATALLRLSWLAAERRNWGAVCGTSGTLEVQDDHLLLKKGAAPRRYGFKEKLSAGSAHPEWLKALFAEFLAEIDDSSRRGRNLEEAAFCADIIDRAYRDGVPRVLLHEEVRL